MGALFWIMMNNPWRVQAWAKDDCTIYPTHKPPDFAAYWSQLKNNLAQPGRPMPSTPWAIPRPSHQKNACLVWRCHPW